MTHAVGKSKSMEMILTGVMLDAHEAQAAGLVARVYPDEELISSAMKMARTIASKSRPSGTRPFFYP